jgi:hypothetical protein
MFSWLEQAGKVPPAFNPQSEKLNRLRWGHGDRWSPASNLRMSFEIPRACKGVVVRLATVKDDSSMVDLNKYLDSKEEAKRASHVPLFSLALQF